MANLTSRVQVTIAAGASATVNPGIVSVSDFTSIIVVPLPPTAGWLNVTIDTNPSSTGVVLTNHGTGTTTLNAFFMYPAQIQGSQRSDTYLGATSAPSIPVTAKTTSPYRLFGFAGGKVDAVGTVANLAANPLIRTGKFANVELHVLCQSPESPGDPVFFTPMVTAINNAQLLVPPMGAYPGARVFPSNLPFSSWVDHSYWVTMANNFRNVAAVRLPGDPRIGIDAENYSTIEGGPEPNLTNLAAHGYTLNDLLTAIQPFIDMLIEVGASPMGMYPNVVGTPALLPRFPALILQALGVDRTEIWGEISFGAAELYRANLVSGFYPLITTIKQFEADYSRALSIPNIRFRHVDDDDELRQWGTIINPGATPPTTGCPAAALGDLPPWFFDETRINNTAGTQAWIDGTDLSALNGADTVFEVRPLSCTNAGGGNPISCGLGVANPLTSEVWAGNASSQAINGSALVNTSLTGIQISAPNGGGLTWVAYRLSSILPPVNTDPWTHKFFDLTIPSSWVASTPLAFIGQNNVEVAMLYYNQASDKIQLLVHASGVQTYDVLASPARDTPHRIVVGRSGTTWRHSVNGGAAVDRTAPSQAPVFQSIFYGMGCDTAMNNNSLAPATGLIITTQAMTFLTLRSLGEFATLSSPSTNYPIGRGS